MQTTSPLHASAEQIAAHLMRAVGGQACYLSMVGNAGQNPRLLLAVGDAHIPPGRSREISPILRRARIRTQPFAVQVGGKPGLALPLACDGRQIAAAVVVYETEGAIDPSRASAAAAMAASALDSARQIAALHLQAEEIAERARVREIQVSRNLLRGVIDSIPLGLALLAPNGTVLAANRALAERFGLDPAALVGMGYAAAIGPWSDSPAAQTFETGAAKLVRRTMNWPDGAQTLLEISSFPLLDADDRPRQAVEVWEDITERVSLQTQLVRAEKLAAIGQLAASIAHEVGNPLQAIQGFLALFLEQCPPGTPNRRFLELAGDEIERIVQVIARLRDLYRPRADVIAEVNLNELVDNVLLLTSKQLERRNIQVLRDLDPDLPQVPCVADQIKQVLLNLVLNATDAMQGGGLLHLRTGVQWVRNDARVANITVGDSGIGIPAEQIPHIFDGLHTTKERGMGLGLYTSKAIVERHMGRLLVQSTVGVGTTFTITLPIET